MRAGIVNIPQRELRALISEGKAQTRLYPYPTQAINVIQLQK
jgi:hypothetical protein